MPDLAKRFWTRVDRRGPDECWLWLGGHTSCGYGALRPDVWGEGKAHRLAWRLANRNVRIPAGMYVCHRCDTPLCCNPAHLFVGTPGDNSRDRNAKGRAAPKVGALNGRAILSEEQVRSVLRDHHGYGDTARLAREHGVSDSAIRLIVQRKHWTHVA